MLVNSFNTSSKKNFLKTLNTSILPPSNIIQYQIFYLFLCVIDLIVLLYYMDYLKFTLPKFGADLIISSLMLIFPNKVSHLHINLFLTITKVTSQIFIIIIGNDFVLIFVFICEVNEISAQQQWEYLGQRIFTKVSGLIIISVNSGINLLYFYFLFHWARYRNFCCKIIFLSVEISVQKAIHQASINGAIIQICDTGASNRKYHTLIIKKATLKSVENSMFTDSFVNFDDLNQKMCDLNYIGPPQKNDIILQTIAIKYDSQEQQIICDSHIRSGKETITKVLSYKMIKLQAEIDNENFLKAFIKRKKCRCQRILSIDDEIFNQKSIQLLLSKQGFEVVLAFNGEEAIKIVKVIERCCPTCSLFLLIITDYQMPIMDGIETTRNLRVMMQEHIIPQIHIIGLTAFNSKKDIKNCIDAGMSDVLPKPLNMKEFYEILSTL